MSVRLVTLEEAASYVDVELIEQGSQTDDLITHISNRIARFTGRDGWGPANSRTEYYDGGTAYIMVRYWPIVSVTNIFDDTEHDWPTSTALAADDFYVSNQQNGIIYSEAGTFTAGFENLKIVYTAGYANEAAIPSDLKTACLLQLWREYRQREPAFGQNDVELLPEVKDLAARYGRGKSFA